MKTNTLTLPRLQFLVFSVLISMAMSVPFFAHAQQEFPDGTPCSPYMHTDSSCLNGYCDNHGLCGTDPSTAVPQQLPGPIGASCAFPENCQSLYCNANNYCEKAPVAPVNGGTVGQPSSGGSLTGGADIQGLYGRIMFIINKILVPLLFAVAFIVFLWGIFEYFIAGGANEEKRKMGRQFMLYGLIGFFVMVSVWGLVAVLVNSFGLGGTAHPAYPLL